MGSKVRSAFTLVEILIVVIILGILAAIVVPQFTSASEDAQISNTETQLSTIRNQIELYRVRNNAQYPDFNTFAGHWGDPTATLASGDPDPIAQGLRGGDYLKKPPINPRTRAVDNSFAPPVAGEPQINGTLILFQAAPTAADVGGWIWDDSVAGNEEMYAARFNEVDREWLD